MCVKLKWASWYMHVQGDGRACGLKRKKVVYKAVCGIHIREKEALVYLWLVKHKEKPCTTFSEGTMELTSIFST